MLGGQPQFGMPLSTACTRRATEFSTGPYSRGRPDAFTLVTVTIVPTLVARSRSKSHGPPLVPAVWLQEIPTGSGPVPPTRPVRPSRLGPHWKSDSPSKGGSAG